MRVTLVDQDRAPDDLHDIDAGKRPQRVAHGKAVLGTVGIHAQLHQLMVGQRLFDLLDHGRGRPALPDPGFGGIGGPPQ